MVIAATAGTAAYESATKESGLINQAFKLAILLFAALAIFATVFLIYNLTNVLDGVVDTITTTTSAITKGLTVVSGPVGWIASGLTFVASAFGFGGRK